MAHACDPAPTLSGSRPVWCVVAALPKAERTAHAELHRRGFPAYLPLLTARLPNRHYRTGPLFPGYLFVQLRLDRPWNPVRYCPGVFSLLSIDGIPSICPDAAVEALQATEALRATPTPDSRYWAPGMPCSLGKPHALIGVPAIVTAVHDHDIADITMIMFGQLRSLSVHVDSLVHREA
jgi:transcription antitermination factor NusG